MKKYEPGMKITPFEIYQDGDTVFFEDTGICRTTVEIEGDVLTVETTIAGEPCGKIPLFPREAAILAGILIEFVGKYKKGV